jgi:hypothetical protein
MRIAPFILLAGLILSAPAHAVGQLADVQVYDRSDGRTLNTYFHNGRYYIAGEPGHEYQIKVVSSSGSRVLVVSSVDGVNVITGDTASTNQSGYVLSPYSSMEIAGWRKSMERINTFFFTTLKNSYAARTGRPNDVGVIGVALFRERQPEPVAPCCWPFRSSQDRSDAPAAKAEASGRLENDAMPAPATEAAQAPQRQEKKLGTGYGRGEDSVTRYTAFERASDTPDEVVAIYYDSASNLIAQGVIPRHYAERRPNAFPNGFVPPP